MDMMVQYHPRELQSKLSCCAAGGQQNRACCCWVMLAGGDEQLTGEDLGAEQELELVQELLGGAVAGDGRLVRLLGDDGQVGDRVEVVLVPVGTGMQGWVQNISTSCAAGCK
jgi:hypothetical protein